MWINDAGHRSYYLPPQIKLLKSAAYGKSLLSEHDASRFVETCRTLRVLNTLRDAQIGFALTYEQYDPIFNNFSAHADGERRGLDHI